MLTNSLSDPPLVSIVIPTHNNESSIRVLLSSLKTQSYSSIETIVSDNNSTDQTARIAKDFGCRVIVAGPERAAQRNAGAHVALGNVLLFIDSDMELTSEVIEECVVRLADADGLCLRESTLSMNYWSRVREFERSAYFRSSIFEAARCFRRDVFESLAGYDPAITGLEDCDLHARFIRAGYRLDWVEHPLIHHEEKVNFFSYLRKRSYYGKTDRVYASKNPETWKDLRSLTHRIRYITKRGVKPAELPLLPGLVLMRGFEWALRT